jgi:hypothetical protein
MVWYDYLREFMQAILAGIIGAWMVHILDYRKFRKEEKYRDDEKKRDALRDLLGDVVPDMLAILSTADRRSDKESLLERAGELHKRVEVVRPLFLGNEKVYRALTTIGNIVGTAAAPDYIPTSHAFDAFSRDVRVLKDELIALEKSLSE